jgi:hypothetical protein
MRSSRSAFDGELEMSMHIRSIIGLIAIFLAAAYMSGPVLAFDLDDLNKIKKQFEAVREKVRKLRGREPAPPPPAPPAADIHPASAAGLTLPGNCVGKDETGYVENARINVTSGQVRQLAVRIDIPKGGSCRYQLAAFRQTKQTPFVEMLANSNPGCALRMWQQGDRVTFAATDCAEKCSKGAFDYAWPVEFNTSGGCY